MVGRRQALDRRLLAAVSPEVFPLRQALDARRWTPAPVPGGLTGSGHAMVPAAGPDPSVPVSYFLRRNS